MDNRLATHSGALTAGEDSASCALEGFLRVEKLLRSIERFASLAGVGELATLAKESALVADSYANLADCDREQFMIAAGRGIKHGQ
jgi:hypothetical protein